jgi:hypothetical protein
MILNQMMMPVMQEMIKQAASVMSKLEAPILLD